MFIRNAVGEAVRAGEDKKKKKACFRQIERDVRSRRPTQEQKSQLTKDRSSQRGTWFL